MKEKLFKLNQLFPLATGILSVIWIYKGIVEYGIWDESMSGPADGLFPALIAAVLLVASIINLVGTFKEEPVTLDPKSFILTGSLIAIYFAAEYLGFLPTLMVFYVLWLKLFAKENWKNTIIATVAVFAVIYLAFSVWLKIPFPQGQLYEMIGR